MFFSSGKGNISSMETRDWEIKTHPFLNVFFLAGRAGFEPATGFTQHSLSRRAHSATLAPSHFQFTIINRQRRKWDSNPRWCDPNMFSRHAPSATRPSLQYSNCVGDFTIIKKRILFRVAKGLNLCYKFNVCTCQKNLSKP